MILAGLKDVLSFSGGFRSVKRGCAGCALPQQTQETSYKPARMMRRCWQQIKIIGTIRTMRDHLGYQGHMTHDDDQDFYWPQEHSRTKKPLQDHRTIKLKESNRAFKRSSQPSNLQTTLQTFKQTSTSSIQPSNLQTKIKTFKLAQKYANHSSDLQAILQTFKPSFKPLNQSSNLQTSLRTFKQSSKYSIQPSELQTNLQTCKSTSQLQTNLETFKPTFKPANQPSNLQTFKPTLKPSNQLTILQTNFLTFKTTVNLQTSLCKPSN